MGFQAKTFGHTQVIRQFSRFDAAVGWAEMHARKHDVQVVVEAGEFVDDEFIPFADGVIVDLYPARMGEAAA